MKTNLTLRFSFLFVLLVGAVSFSYAQTFFEVTTPASIAGTYPYSHPVDWGGDFPDCADNFTIEAEIEIIDDADDAGGTGTTTDGCEAAVNDLTGKIALVDRGLCEFSTKALIAQNAGAIGVIICNNIPGDPAQAMPGGTDAPSVTIPAWSLSFEDCAIIRAEIPTVEGRVFWTAPPVGSDVVLWGANPGEGDFDGGLNGWTTTDLSCANGGTDPLWVWSAEALANQGAFSAGGGFSLANTACNGAMAFDSDFLDNGGDPGNLGGGSCTANQVGELISPPIDLSAISTSGGISLKWHQALREFNSTHTVSYSNNNGTTWFDVEVNSDIEVNSPHLNETRRVILPDADLTATQFRVKFTYTANYYYWIIDDVQLIEAENNNLAVMSNFYAIAPNAMWPKSQVEEFSFLADISNNGAAAQPNTNLNVTIVDDNTSAVVHSSDLNYGLVESDTLVENVPFASCFEPDGTVTTYTGTYTITSDSVDFDESDNSRSFQFMVTDSVFAKETGVTRTVVPAAGNWDAGEPHSWAYGNFYHIVNGGDAPDPENQWYAESVDFGIGNANQLTGTLLTIFLYEWTSDNNMDGDMDPDERTPVGFANYEILGTESSTALINVALKEFPSGEDGVLVPLFSGGNYVVMVEYITSTTQDFSLQAAEPWDYAAQTLRSNPSVITDPALQKPYRPAEMLGISGDLSTEPYSAAGFTGTVVPAVRLRLARQETISVDVLDAANIIAVSPNPASDFISLNMEMINTQPEVEIRIMDAAGKVVLDRVYDNVTKETYNYDVSNFAAGAYLLNVITKEGVRTERFIIQR